MNNTQRKWVAVVVGAAAIVVIAYQWSFATVASRLEQAAPLHKTENPTPSTAIPPTHVDNNIRTNSILIGFKEDTTEEDRNLLVESLGGKIVQYDPRSRIAVVVLAPRKSSADMINIAQELGRKPHVEFASPDIPLQYYGTNN
jgi:hypothetical protein